MKTNIWSILVLTIFPIIAFGEKVKVKTVNVTLEQKQERLTFGGTFFPEKEAVLGAANAGQITKIYFPVGSKVEKNDIIVSLTDEMLKQQKIDMEIKQQDFQRVERLYQKESISKQKYEHMQGLYEASKERYELLEKNTLVKAPFSGTVVEHLMNEGEIYLMINPALEMGYSHSNGIVRIMKMDTLIFKIDVNEKEYPFIQKGYTAQIETQAYPGKKWKGTVNQKAAFLSAKTHSGEIEILVDNQEGKLSPGMFGKCEIFISTGKGIKIPRDAVISNETGNEKYIYIVSGQKAVKKEIEITGSEGDYFYVKGIDSGTEIITAGKTKVENGTEIEVIGGSL